MKQNIGKIDRSIRIAAGVGLIGVAVIIPGMTWAYIGVVPLLTGLAGLCPAYCVFGNCKMRSGK